MILFWLAEEFGYISGKRIIVKQLGEESFPLLLGDLLPPHMETKH